MRDEGASPGLDEAGSRCPGQDVGIAAADAQKGLTEPSALVVRLERAIRHFRLQAAHDCGPREDHVLGLTAAGRAAGLAWRESSRQGDDASPGRRGRS
jgi:hypothetical protein